MTVLRQAFWLSILFVILTFTADASAASGDEQSEGAKRPSVSSASHRAERTAAAVQRRTRRSSYRPASSRGAESSVIARRHASQEEVVPMLQGPLVDDGMIYESVPGEFLPGELPLPGSSDCGGCGGDACNSCCLLPCPIFSLSNLDIFSGSHGFTGPANRGQTGSFGFHEGANVGVPMPCFLGGSLAGQVGFQAVHSNFSGAEFTDEERNQIFLTMGLFRRVDWGIQGGLVVDYMHDDWYYEIDLTQLRGELSWMYPSGHELGFWFAASVEEDTQNSLIFDPPGNPQTLTETFEPTDLYAFFYRHHFRACPGAEGRFYAGFTDNSDGLIGSDIRLPINDYLAVESGYTYLIPEDGARAHEQESWNLAINLVWYPGSACRQDNYNRPLFRVANNGSFMFDRQ